MSSHSDESPVPAAGTGAPPSTSESFWEPGNYKRTTKRVEDGHKLCTDLHQLIQERCDIEKAYAKSLHAWSKRWNESITRGPEYGTTEAAWKAVLGEADRLSELHLGMRDQLTDQVLVEIRNWQKDNFHRSMMQIREKRDFDDHFKRVQRPWAKCLERVNRCKLDYHLACKNERTLSIQERNAASDTSISPDQLKKLRDRVERARDDAAKLKERYQLALDELQHHNPRYVHEMTQVFDKCQAMEQQRLNFIKDILFKVHQCLNIASNPQLKTLYEEYRHTLQNADSSKDLKWWSSTYGIGMTMNWPQFEPFSEEFRDIIKDTKAKKVNSSNDGITLINQHRFNEELPDWSESFTTNGSLIDSGESGTGVSVRALYDYHGAEDDELSFKQGDIFVKLEDEDEQGWCKGRKDDRDGLYPANYVEVLAEKH